MLYRRLSKLQELLSATTSLDKAKPEKKEAVSGKMSYIDGGQGLVRTNQHTSSLNHHHMYFPPPSSLKHRKSATLQFHSVCMYHMLAVQNHVSIVTRRHSMQAEARRTDAEKACNQITDVAREEVGGASDMHGVT